MTEQLVLDIPQEREIRDELQRLVLADLHGPLCGDEEEFSGENPIDRYPLGRLAPRGVVLEPDTHDDLAAADAGLSHYESFEHFHATVYRYVESAEELGPGLECRDHRLVELHRRGI